MRTSSRAAIHRGRLATTCSSFCALVLALVLGIAPFTSAPAAQGAVVSQTIWGTSTPTYSLMSDEDSVVLGTRFSSDEDGTVTAIRFFNATSDTDSHTAYLWDANGKMLTSVNVTSRGRGWVEATLSDPQDISADEEYVVGYKAPDGEYAYAYYALGGGRTISSDDLTAIGSAYSYSGTFPRQSYRNTAYFVDVRFVPSDDDDATPTPSPSTSTRTPTPTPSATTATPTPSPSTTRTPTPTPTPSTSTPTPTPTPTTAKPTTSVSAAPRASGSDLNCIVKPSACGYPDASNTGVPSTATLKRVPDDVKSGTGWTWDSRGWISAGDGAIVENLIVPGPIEVTGKNAIVRNNRITATGETWAVALRHATNATVQNNEIGVMGASRLMVGIKDIYGDSPGTQILANDIANTSTGVQIGQGLIEGNYIHDLGYKDGDHLNGTTSNGGTTQLTIRGNTILNKYQQTDAISLFQDFGVEANRLITGNLVAGGGYTIYGGNNQNFGKTYNIKITNNRFSTIYFPNCGYYGPYTAYDPSGTGNEFSGNIWDNTGQALR